MKGQVALEYLIIFTVILLAIVPLAFIATSNTELTRITSETSAALGTISAAADSVYAMGPGSQTTVQVFIPRAYDYHQSSFSGKEIVMGIFINNRFEEPFRLGNAQIRGNMPKGPNVQFVNVKMTDKGYVLVNDAKVINTPGYYSLLANKSSSGIKGLVVTNVYSSSLNLQTNFTGPAWITLSNNNLGTMASGANKTMNVTYSVPANASITTYLAYIQIQDQATSEEYAWIPIRVRVVK
jgi:uncharacterized protein (UPF0333 family)